MRRKNWKKVLAVILTSAMVVGVTPALAFAETEEPVAEAEVVDEATEEAEVEEPAEETEVVDEAAPAEEPAAVEEPVEEPAEQVEEPAAEVAEAEAADATAAVEAKLADDDEEDKDVYVLMNIPYDVFYKAVGGVEVDATSGATAKVRNVSRAAMYNGGGDATDATSNTAKAKGVQFPVKVNTSILNGENYSEVTDSTSYDVRWTARGTVESKTLTGKDALIQDGDYAYYILDAAPKNYLELTADGFSSLQGDVAEITGSEDDITYSGSYGAYQVAFDKNLLPDSGTTYGASAVKVVTNNLTFGVTATDHLWTNEIAWDPEGDLAATNAATLQYIIVYTISGVYKVTYNEALTKKVYDGNVTVDLYEGTGTLSNLPSDIENAKATVQLGSGRKPTIFVDTATVTDGAFTIPSDAGLEIGTEYTVVISSDNYVNITVNATYNATIYVLMNIPYDEFYTAQNVTVDATSGATKKVRNSGVAGAVYNGEGSVNADTAASVAKGVQYAVKANSALLTGEKVTDSTSYHVYYAGRGDDVTDKDLTGKEALIQADDYAYYVLDTEPSNYLELTEDGFSAVKGNITSVEAASTISYGGHWGAYIVEWPTTIEGNVAGVKVVTDKLTFGITATDHVWRNVEFGWYPVDELAETNGVTLQSYTVYTDAGVYEVKVNQELKLYDTDGITATLSGLAGGISSLPSDIVNAKATVSITTGRGETANTTTYVSPVTVGSDGSFDISKPAEALTDGTTYTVTVTSDNYIDLTTTAKYDSTIYVLMNIPYKVFEDAVANDEAVDAVASATLKIRNASLAGAIYNATGNDVNTTANSDDVSRGVQYAVKVDDATLLTGTRLKSTTSYRIFYSARGTETYTTVKGKAALIQAGSYAYYPLTETPAVYLELTESGYSGVKFSAEDGGVTSVDGSSTSITYGGHHTTYEMNIASGVSGTVAAVEVVTDKLTFWLRPTDQIWRSIQIGWDPENELAETNGAKLESYTVYTDEGVYNVTVDQQLKEDSGNTIAATLKDSTGTVSEYPSDANNLAVTVSSSSTNAQGRTTLTPVKGLENVTVNSDGTFTIPANTLTDGTEYTVTLSSDNYLDLSTTATYSVTPTPTPTAAASTKSTTTASTKSTTTASTKSTTPTVAKIVSASFLPLRLRSTTQTKTSVTLKWTKVSGAVKYELYGVKCGTALSKAKKLKTTTKLTYKKSGLKKATYYKFYVIAKDAKGNTIAKSIVVHAATKGGKVGNHKSVTIKSKKTVTLSKAGKTSKIKATAVKSSKRITVKKHVGLRYESSNTAVAKVSSSGKITAVAKGTCYIYVYAQDGVYSKVKVKVKK